MRHQDTEGSPSPERRTSDHLARQSLTISTVLCLVSLIFPTFTAIGWIFGIRLLTQGHPMLPPMQPNTAMGLALCALAILLTPAGPSMGRRTPIVLVLASAVLLLGLLTLGEYGFGWNLGTDWIFAHRAPAIGQPFPGLPSPQSSLNFAILGAVLLIFNLRTGPHYLGQIGAVAAGANALAAMTGYIFSPHSLYGFPLLTPAIGMAVQTAMSFVLLVVALFCRRPRDGMMTLVTSATRIGRMTRLILVAGTVAPPLVGALTRVGVALGWYDVTTQGALFVLVMAGLLLRTVWRSARRSEHEELQAQTALAGLARANEHLNRAVAERQIFAALVENSSDFIGIADPAGKPVYLNPAGRRLVGLTPEFPVDRTVMLDFYTPDQRAFAFEVILKSMVEDGHWEGETVFRHWQTGRTIPVSDTHFIIRDPETSRVLGMGTVTRDISEIRRAREEIELSNRQLAQANDQITLLYEKVVSLDAIKTRFFANVSHELRTPLTLILGPVEKHLQAPGLDAGLRLDLQVIERNARTVLRHVNDLLDVSRLDAGHLRAEYSETDAAALVHGVADHFATLAAENRIDFTVETPAAFPVQTDGDMLQRILLNLLSNAFKFTPREGRVRVSLRAIGPRFRLEVADSGPGIPTDRRDAVFERFEQLAPDAKRQRSGTGLGLSIVWEFALLLEGTVSIRDAPEGGALFVVELPSAAADRIAVRSGANERLSAQEIGHPNDGGKRSVGGNADTTPSGAGRVLVVEDNPDMNLLVAENLQEDGFEVLSAFNGHEGYEKAITEHPDLVLTDVMMPIVSGEELVRLMRQRRELDSIPIVVLTAKGDDALRVRLLREGVQDYLDKPFSVAELRARVRNLIGRKRAEDHVSRLSRQLEVVALASTEVSEAVAGLPEESVRSVLQTIALNAQNLTGAEFAAAGIGGDSTRPFEIWAFVGMSQEQVVKIGRPPRRVGLLGLTFKENHSFRLRDLRRHPDFRGFPTNYPEMRSLLGVPISYRGRTVGNLYLSNKRGAPEFTAEDQQRVEMLAARAGVAIETARLYAAEGRAHAWLQAVIDQMLEGIILMDAEGRVTMHNQSMGALMNAKPATPDSFGNPVTIDLRRLSGEPLAPDDLPIVKAIVNHEVTRGHEFIGRRADDRLVPLLVSAAPILGSNGNLAGAVMVLQDVSTLKELEHMREEWASIVAHDLRQPISVIALRSTLLLRPGLSNEQREDVLQIRSSAQRLSRMVSDLTDASLLETRRMQVTLERLDLGELLHDVVERFPLAARRTRIRTPSDRHLFIQGDAQRLEQVVDNLLSNAIKYGTPGSEIDLELTSADGKAEIAVTNRGAGIPPDELPLIFERYVRSRTTGTRTRKGLGLGLYIATGLIEAHQGRLWAQSVPGGITSFHVIIPLDGLPVAVDGSSSGESGPSHREQRA